MSTGRPPRPPGRRGVTRECDGFVVRSSLTYESWYEDARAENEARLSELYDDLFGSAAARRR
jgi:hypothetical protein